MQVRGHCLGWHVYTLPTLGWLVRGGGGGGEEKKEEKGIFYSYKPVKANQTKIRSVSLF